VRPGPDALRYAQDKLLMRERLSEFGLPVPDWARVTTMGELDDFIAEHAGAAVVKTARGGYDGKGVRIVRSAAEVADWFAAIAEDGHEGALLVEEVVEFRRELAQLVARRPGGEVAAWPVVETVQVGGVCSEVIAPAPRSAGRLADVAADVAITIAERLGVVGVLAVELFETTDDRVLVNELAMRPHNTGHWSMDGAVTGQFENHLRAVMDLPLGSPAPRARWTVMVNILGGPTDTGRLYDGFPHAMARDPHLRVHLYGKDLRPGRKVGHVNAYGDDLDDCLERARHAAAWFRGDLGNHSE
jgi:5-(carboxyamino)imidazole ribonucleotide synthase